MIEKSANANPETRTDQSPEGCKGAAVSIATTTQRGEVVAAEGSVVTSKRVA